MRHQKKNLLSTFFEIFDLYPREYFVAAFFALFFISIVFHSFLYSVVQHKFYKGLADSQQIGEAAIPVTRGNIYSSVKLGDSTGTILSTSVDLNDLAIDPQITGDKDRLVAFLTDILYKQMCYLAARDDCYDDMLRFLRVIDIPDFKTSEKYLKAKINNRLQEKIAKDKVTSVRLMENLSISEEQTISLWNIAGVYTSENGLYVNPEELTERERFSVLYSEFSGSDPEKVLHQVRRRDLRYISIYQKLGIRLSDEVEDYIAQERISLKQGIIEKVESIGGFIILTPHAQRIYPERGVAAQITGFLNNEGTGQYGIEGFYDELLRGNPGARVSRKDTKGRTIEAINSKDANAAAQEGVNIYTTIDRNVQKKVEEILEGKVNAYDANSATVVVMEPKTGKVISMATYPSFDPNNPGEVYELRRVYDDEVSDPETAFLGKTLLVEDLERGEPYYYNGEKKFLRRATREEYGDFSRKRYIYKNNFGARVYQNNAISGLYEPGSIMKALTVAIGIDTNEITSYELYNDIGEVTIDNFTIANVDKRCLGYHSFTHALSFSCNVGMIRIVQRVGKALMYKYFVDFGFDEETGIALKGEVYSKIDPFEKWPTSKLLTTSYGLGISVTPLQMAAAYSTIANGGVYMKPYVVEKIEHADGRVFDFKPQKLRRVLKESTANIVTKMLVKGVSDGVAKNGGVPGYLVAGKTGTSQIAYRGKYEEGIGSTTASFAGYAPAQDPKFTIIVKVDRPRTNQYGGSTAAFIFSEIADSLFKYYSIPPSELIDQ